MADWVLYKNGNIVRVPTQVKGHRSRVTFTLPSELGRQPYNDKGLAVLREMKDRMVRP